MHLAAKGEKAAEYQTPQVYFYQKFSQRKIPMQETVY